MAPPGRKSSGGKKAARVDDSDDSDGDELRLPKYGDIRPEYLNQPVDQKQGESKLKTLIGELSTLANALKKSADNLTDVAGDLAESLRKDDDVELDYDNLPEDPDEIKQLDKELRAVLDKAYEVEIRKKALSDTRQRIAQGFPIADIFDVYEKRTAGPLAERAKMTSRQRFLEDDIYTGFRVLIFEAMYSERAVPSMKKLIPAEADDAEDSDDELEVGAQSTDYKCPLTLRLLEDAYSSTKCPHHYSGKYIREYLKKGPQGCPMSGCPQKLSLADIEKDEGLQRRVDASARRAAQDKSNGVSGTQKGKSATQYEIVSDEED